MKKLIIVAGLILTLLFLGLLWWADGLSPVNSTNKGSVDFTIDKGSGLKEISGELETTGLIKNRIIFFLYARSNRFEEKIQAGNFRLSPSMTAQEIAQNLTLGISDITITIPEGKRATEIAETLQTKLPTYNSSWINILIQNEGYLFPDTYNIQKDATIETIVITMRNNFEKKYTEINGSNSKFTKSKIVIIASLIEREAITDEEKPIIAGILINRLDAGMALQVDATIQYAKGQNQLNKKWWEPVTIEEYKSVKSNYNTYLFAGLPPSPISNPGAEALRAAAFPADTNFLYYLHDKDGKIRYATTLSGHEANIKKYGVN